jgi:ketosteroid isomerase-like protein
MSISRREFLRYIEAFNAKDYATQHSFYHSDVRLVIPDPKVGTLYGPAGIMNHYSVVHDLAEETVVPMIVLIDGDLVFFIMETYFRYTKPTDHAVHGHKVRVGDVIRVKVWATYEMKDGKMLQIRCNGLTDELLGQIDVDKAIEDSWNRADEKVKAEWKPKFLM